MLSDTETPLVSAGNVVGVDAEGGNKSTFNDCLFLISSKPFLLYLAFSAAIGLLLFGYDIGGIAGALLYIRNDFETVNKSTLLQETIVTVVVVGAIIGSSVGGWMCDKFGRRTVILLQDLFLIVGTVVMVLAANPSYLIVGRIVLGIGFGIAFITCPLYTSEISPTKFRGALINFTSLLVAIGKFLAFLVNLSITKTEGKWRWMFGAAAVPIALQFGIMLFLPESPSWLFRKKREGEAIRVLRKINDEMEVQLAIKTLTHSIEAEMKEKAASHSKINLIKMFKVKAVRRGLMIGVSLQIFQQCVGSSTVMYYSTTIIELAGFASNKTVVGLSLVVTGLNTLAVILSMIVVDRIGRRIIMIISLCGIIVSLGLLSTVFHYTGTDSPQVQLPGTDDLSAYTCPAYLSSGRKYEWDCMECLAVASQDCGFCASSGNKLLPGSCLIMNATAGGKCNNDQRQWYTRGCPSQYGWVAMIGLTMYIISYASGIGCAVWVINAEIYPLRFRGTCCGIATTAYWLANLATNLSFLSINKAIGISQTFMIYGLIGVVALIFVVAFVPETKGLHAEEVEKVLGDNLVQLKF